MKRKIVFFGLIALLAVCAYLISVSNSDSFRTGQSFMSESAFFDQATKDGYVFLGKFNPSWPAEIVKVERRNNDITIDVPGHGIQSYPGYNGYRLVAVTLKRSDGQFAGYILRSDKK